MAALTRRRGLGRWLLILRTLFRPRALWRYLRDPRTKRLPKLLLFAASLYLILPIDVFPDLVPLIGWIDDVGLVALALTYLSRCVVEHERASALEEEEAERPSETLGKTTLAP